MHLVVIIGAGNIGSRHLQAFAKSNTEIKIIVIDPSQASLDVCKARWIEVNNFNNIVEVIFQKDYLNIPKEIDLAIISTNSEHRYNALEQLIIHCRGKTILLEKFLFSKEDEYQKASLLIEEQHTKVYVNLVRRVFEAYQFVLKELSTQSGTLSMQVSGNNWGMASNSVHFIDLFCYLTDDAIFKCDFTNTDSTKIITSKREGYIEFIGNLAVETTRGNKLNITCNEGVYDEIIIILKKGDIQIKIEERESGIIVYVENKNTTHKFPYPFQSQLTLNYFMDFAEGKSLLTPYNQSAAMHLSFLQAVKNLLSTTNNQQVWKIT